MNAPMPDSILHEPDRLPTSTQTLITDENQRILLSILGVLGSEPLCRLSAATTSGNTNLPWLRRGALHSLGPALAHKQQTDALQKVGRRVHSPGEEYVRLRVVVIDADLARNKDRRNLWSDRLDGSDQLWAVHSWHRHVCHY